MEIININSGLYDQNKKQLNRLLIKDLEGEIDKLSNNFCRVPIYMVNEELMDLIYPPHKRKGIDIDNFNLNESYSYNDEETAIFNFPPQTSYNNEVVIAIGLYCTSLKWKTLVKKTYADPEMWYHVNKIMNPDSRCIFICPERVKKLAINQVPDVFVLSEDGSTHRKLTNNKKRTKVFNTLFIAVALHEIAHAYMDQNNSKKRKLDEVCDNLIEESFANAMAWSQFKKLSDRRIVEKFMDSQPFVYRSYRYWINNSKPKKSLPFLISSWANKVDPFITEYSFENINEALFGNKMSLKEYESLKKHSNNYSFQDALRYSRLIKRIHASSFWSLVGESIIAWTLGNRSRV